MRLPTTEGQMPHVPALHLQCRGQQCWQNQARCSRPKKRAGRKQDTTGPHIRGKGRTKQCQGRAATGPSRATESRGRSEARLGSHNATQTRQGACDVSNKWLQQHKLVTFQVQVAMHSFACGGQPVVHLLSNVACDFRIPIPFPASQPVPQP